MKVNIKAPCHWPLWGESTSHWWIPLTKGQWHRKCFYLMMASCRESSDCIVAKLYHKYHGNTFSDTLFWWKQSWHSAAQWVDLKYQSTKMSIVPKFDAYHSMFINVLWIPKFDLTQNPNSLLDLKVLICIYVHVHMHTHTHTWSHTHTYTQYACIDCKHACLHTCMPDTVFCWDLRNGDRWPIKLENMGTLMTFLCSVLI